MDIFKPFKDRIKKDVTKFAQEKFSDIKDEFLSMAKSLDLDSNGVKDPEQVLGDFSLLKVGCLEFKGAFVVVHDVVKEGDKEKKILNSFHLDFKQTRSGSAKVRKAVGDLSQLAMVYYLHYGPKKPSVVEAEKIAALESKKDSEIA